MAPLTADAKRLRVIIISFPLLVVTSAILYRRTYMGEKQRTIPRPGDGAQTELPSILTGGKPPGQQ
ncbi:uncharacterized protein LOC62_01G000425 [Vanrija pseudolonga]|uniref:Uncharacterized protein n=1 Tax=Vanrija pseudolonga TaxID=143232 RepID=A0AAF0Y4Z8_9TREE|nr:hypothetical protein LOC62_01G000425 [Vanrija pseudolonga]